MGAAVSARWKRYVQGTIASPAYLVLVASVFLATTSRVLPTGGQAASLLASHLAVSFLFGFNNYRGRAGDVHSPKREIRPLAGTAERVVAVEAILVGVAVAAVAVPAAAGAPAQAALDAAAVVLYMVLFRERTAATPRPL